MISDMDKHTESKHLNRRSLAERWLCSTETIKRRERAGILPCLKIGRGILYRLSDIEKIEAQAEVSR
jgi:hypothetical protein